MRAVKRFPGGAGSVRGWRRSRAAPYAHTAAREIPIARSERLTSASIPYNLPQPMFTGLVEAKGTLLARRPRGPGAQLEIRCNLMTSGPLVLGESISVDGVCLTVQTITADGFLATPPAETLEPDDARRPPAAVGPERATPSAGDETHRHGHVDAAGVLLEDPVSDRPDGVNPQPGAFRRREGIHRRQRHQPDSERADADGSTWSSRARRRSPPRQPGRAGKFEVDVLARYVLRAREVEASPAGRALSDEEWMARLRTSGYL